MAVHPLLREKSTSGIFHSTFIIQIFCYENILAFVTVWIVKLVVHDCLYEYSVCVFCKQTVIINIYMNIDITIVESK